MRPRGEIREALAVAVSRLAAERGPVSAREVAAAAQLTLPDGRVQTGVQYEVARLTLKDMARSVRPEVVRVGSCNEGGGKMRFALYEPAEAPGPDTPQPWGGIEALSSVMREWPGAG